MQWVRLGQKQKEKMHYDRMAVSKHTLGTVFLHIFLGGDQVGAIFINCRCKSGPNTLHEALDIGFESKDD